MADRADIVASFGGRSAGPDTEAIMASFGGANAGNATPTPTPGDLVSPASYTIPARTQRYALQSAGAPVASWTIQPGLDGDAFTIDAVTGVLSPKDQTVADLAAISAPVTKQVRVRALLASGGAVEPVQPRSFTFTPMAAAMAAGEAFASDFTGTAGTALETLPGWTLYQRGTPTARPTPVRAGGGRLKGRPDSGDARNWSVLRSFTDASGAKTFRLTGIDMSVQGKVSLCLLADAALDSGVYVGFEAQPGTPGYTVVNNVMTRQGGAFSTAKVTLEPGPVYVVGRAGDNTIDLICITNTAATQMIVYANGRLGSAGGAIGTYKVATIDLTGLTLGKLYGFGSSDGDVPLGQNISVGALTMETGSTATLTVTDAPTYSRTNVARYRLTYAGAAGKPVGLQHRFPLILGGSTPWITGEAMVTGGTSGTIEYLADAPGAGEYGAPEFRLYDDIATRATAENGIFMLSTDPLLSVGFGMGGSIDFRGGNILNDHGKTSRIQNSGTTVFIHRFDVNTLPGFVDTIQTNTGVTMQSASESSLQIVSTTPSTGQHTIRILSDKLPGGEADRYFIMSGTPCTRFNVTRGGRTGKIMPEAITGFPDFAVGVRDLDMELANQAPVEGEATRPLPTDYRYTLDSGIGNVLPWEDRVDYVAALAAAKPNLRFFWTNIPADLPETKIRARFEYFRDAVPTRIKLRPENSNETPWNNGNGFTMSHRAMREGVMAGFWGELTTFANPKPTKAVKWGGVDATTGPAASAGDWVMRNVTIFEAKRNVAAGTSLVEGADWTIRYDVDPITAGKRWNAYRHDRIITIAQEVFGASYASRVEPVLMGQLALGDFIDTLMTPEQTFVPGYFAKVTHWGASTYFNIEPSLDAQNTTWTEDQLHASLYAAAPAILRAIKMTALAAKRAGKKYASYEGILHVPRNFGAANQATWNAYFASTRGRAWIAYIIRLLKENVEGEVMLYVGIGHELTYAYQRTWADTANPKLLGVMDGLAA